MTQLVLSVKEAAKVAGVTDATIYNWISAGKIPKIENDGNVGINAADLTAFVNARPEPAAPAAKAPKAPKASAKKPRVSKANGASHAANGAAHDGMLTVGEAAKLVGVSSSSVQNWITAKRFPSKKVGSARLIPRAGFEKFRATYTPAAHAGRPRGSRAVKATVVKGLMLGAGTDLLTAAEAAEIARVSMATFYHWIGEKRFKTSKQGIRTMVDRASFNAFLATYPGNPRKRKDDVTPQGQLPFSAVRQLARGAERAAEFGGQVPRADHLASLDMAEQIGNELGAALGNYRKHVLRKYLTELLAKLDAEP